MKKLFVAMTVVTAVSATAFSGNNKMTDNVSGYSDTVVTDSSLSLASAIDTVITDTAETEYTAGNLLLSLNDDTLTTDTLVSEDSLLGYSLTVADDTLSADTVISEMPAGLFLAMTLGDNPEKSDTTVTEEKVEEVVEKISECIFRA